MYDDNDKEPESKRAVVQIALDDEHAGAVEELLAGVLEVGIVVVVEVIEADDAVAAALQGVGDMRANEAGSVGDEDGAVGGGGAAGGFGDALPSRSRPRCRRGYGGG
ncbi:hypothetical protein RIF29_30365 [Crotalaria pallida]|uniref:Uncharacterized protein n=1 Tax=Crotalaria pallida TaxID=3830 RepID=A0AAN9HWM9_CROPI